MSTFLKLASAITGANYNRLKNATDQSKTKVLALGLAVMVPVVIWAACSFLLAHAVMETGWLTASTAALLLGFLVFTIERLVVMGNGHWLTTFFRMILAAVVAWLGATLFDLVLFRQDIEQQLPAIRHAVAMKAQQMKAEEFGERHGIASKEAEAKVLMATYSDQQQQALDEAAGLAGSRIKGAGSATNFKQQVADRTLAELKEKEAEIANLKAQGAQLQKAAYDTTYARFNEKSLLYRIKAMKQLLVENSEMKSLYWAITIFLFLIEFLVIIFKITWPKSAYEIELDMLEKLHILRSERLVNAQAAMQQPHRVNDAANSKTTQMKNDLTGLM
jgi:hypothetical protein